MFILSLVASIVLWGYNVSLVFNSYVKFCEKAFKYREVLYKEQLGLKDLRKANVKLSVGIALVYIALLYINEITPLLLILIGIKFLCSLYFSDSFQQSLIAGGKIPAKLYWQMKIDALTNVCGASFIALVLVL